MSTSISSRIGSTAAPRQDTCKIHGAFESVNYLGRIWSKCPVCTAQAAALTKQKEEAQERATRKAAWEQRLGDACIPERFTDRTLNNFVATTPEQVSALAFATAYADGFAEVLKTGRCAMFVGNVGTGSRVANAAPVYAFQPEASAIDPIEVPPNAKVYAAYITTSANIQIDVAGDAYHYTKADAS